jgi:hypothetical protein
MSTTTFTDALTQTERLARQVLPPELHERLSCAVALVRDGAVFQADDGTWTVASTSTLDRHYSVNESCSCEDAFYRAPEGRCKHKLAQLLARKVAALMTVAALPADPEPTPEVVDAHVKNSPLGEAPASVNCHITIADRDCQLTLRDVDEGRLLARLQAVLARYPVHGESHRPPQAASQGQEGWCAVHSFQMKWNEGKEGKRGWWSHKTDQGWCKGH